MHRWINPVGLLVWHDFSTSHRIGVQQYNAHSRERSTMRNRMPSHRETTTRIAGRLWWRYVERIVHTLNMFGAVFLTTHTHTRKNAFRGQVTRAKVRSPPYRCELLHTKTHTHHVDQLQFACAVRWWHANNYAFILRTLTCCVRKYRIVRCIDCGHNCGKFSHNAARTVRWIIAEYEYARLSVGRSFGSSSQSPTCKWKYEWHVRALSALRCVALRFGELSSHADWLIRRSFAGKGRYADYFAS